MLEWHGHFSIVGTANDGNFGRDGKPLGNRQMSAVERLDSQDALVASPRDIRNVAIAAVSKSHSNAQEDISAVPKHDRLARGDRLRPLLALIPYLVRYPAKALGALVALTVASWPHLSFLLQCGV